MKFYICKNCKGSNFKLNPYRDGISIICNQCLEENVYKNCAEFNELDDDLNIREIES